MKRITLQKFEQEKERILARMRRQAAAFPEDEKKQSERVNRAANDLLFFCKTYLPHYFSEDFDRPHYQWAKLTEIKDMPVFGAGPPETGKTALFEIALPLHHIVFHLFQYGLQACKTLEQSTDRVSFVRLELEENQRILQDFGEQRGRKWEEGDFITKHEIRYKAISVKTAIYGLTYKQWRPTFLVISDVEDEKTVSSVKITKKIYEWIIRHVKARMADGYKMFYFGNIIHPKMALKRFLDKKTESGKRRYPGGLWTLRRRGKSRFPNLWPAHRIHKEEMAMGKVEFARAYDFEGLEDDKKFRPEWFIEEAPEILVGIQLEVCGGIDPSPEPNAQKSNDQKALVVVGKEPAKNIYHAVDAFIKVCSIDEMIGAAFLFQTRWQVQRWLMRGPKVEELYRRIFDEAARRRGRLPLPVHVENENLNKIMKIGNGLPTYFERGILRFVTANGHVGKILDEAELFPDGYLDGLDGLHMALRCFDIRETIDNFVLAL